MTNQHAKVLPLAPALIKRCDGVIESAHIVADAIKEGMVFRYLHGQLIGPPGIAGTRRMRKQGSGCARPSCAPSLR